MALLAGMVAYRPEKSASSQGRKEPASVLGNPPSRSDDWPELAIAQHVLTESIARLEGQADPILLEAAVVRLAAIQEEVRCLADGKLVFTATEAWRTVYDQIIRSPGIAYYHSVAWLRSEDYWQDTPGQRSIQTNYERLQQGLVIERIFILCDFFWPPSAPLPADDIRRWIDDQYRQGMQIGLVRESAIAAEADLLCDIGIYGSRATGTLELDLQCRTTRFTFDFTAEGIRLAEERWKRLLLYMVPYAELLAKTLPSR